MTKKTIAAALAAFLALAADAAWKGIGEASWYSGPKITEEDLAGKVVLVDEWGVNCGPCRALLPRMQAIWNSFKSKPFMLIGSHRQGRQTEKIQELVKSNKLTYPIYESAGIAQGEPSNGGGIPFLYVVNDRGKVIYSGRDERAATEAVVNALGELGKPPSILGGYIFEKGNPFKGLEKQLELGKPVDAIIKKLEKEVEKGQKRSSAKDPKAMEAASAAQSILSAIKSGRAEVVEDINRCVKSNPEEAYKLAMLFTKSFPKESEFKDRLPEMKKAAAEWKAEQKEKAKEAAKAAKSKGAK